ncbi:glycosyltransferase 87 family protein [Actinoplanes sp. NPDC026619]|uniref:glycosyltransferase 87 family protein n=1 Tax=Actinoplanes sp. NPDC026619 TaxID=3155798 RepID=UPI0033E9E8BB
MRRSAVVTLGCFGATLLVAWLFQQYALGAAAVDHSAVHDWVAGNDLYAGRTGTVLTPPGAILFAPAAVLPLPAVGWMLALAGVVALLLGLIALVGPVARRYGRRRGPAVATAAALALLTEPVRATLGLGCLDLIVFGLVTADVVALRRSAWARSRAAWWPGLPASHPPRGRSGVLRRFWETGAWAGIGVGVATALTVSPVLFLAYLVVSRQWRAAITAAATTASMLVAAFLIAPRTTSTWFGSVLPKLDRSGSLDALDNQSLAGVLARLYDSATTPVLIWLSFAGLLVAVGMIRARSAHAEGDEITAFTLVGLTGAAIGPVSRIHELVWVLPAILILVDAAARRRVAVRRFRPERFPGARFAISAAVVYALLVVDPRWTAGWDAYAIVLIALLNALPWRPGVAPAVPARRRPEPAARRAPAIPGPRGS